MAYTTNPYVILVIGALVLTGIVYLWYTDNMKF